MEVDKKIFISKYIHCAEEIALEEIWRVKTSNEKILELNFMKVYDLSPLQDLYQLEWLMLPDTQVSDLSPLKELINLQSLFLSETKVSDLESIKNLTNLKELSLDFNTISDLSPLINLHNLEILIISYTQVNDLNPLKNLKKLKTLEANNTLITDLSPLENLEGLEVLNIQWTKISDLSPIKKLLRKGINIKFGESNGDKGIFIDTCPIINPPLYIVEKGNKAILNYFEEFENKEITINNQTKLILVGNSRTGKTSLSEYLRDGGYYLEQDSTHGINVDTWVNNRLLPDSDMPLVAHIWDFGGQEYYHATHRIFLAENAVYVLLWEGDSNEHGSKVERVRIEDNSKEEVEVEIEHFPTSYWLQNIQHYGRNCKVLIVQNKVDSDNQIALYSEDTKDISDCFHVSLQNSYNFELGEKSLKRYYLKFQDFKERLLELLRKNATAFKLVKYYVQVREALEALAKEKEFITVSELKEIALGFDETPDLENLLAYLKSFTNTVLYFPQNPLLHDRLYLNPTHISRDIYKILNTIVRENKGKFDLAHIKTRLKLSDEEEVERFVALMREFDLIFEKTKTNKGESIRVFIAPQYLPKKEDLSDDILLFVNEMTFEKAFSIQFKSFVPRSLMLRFIANNGALSNQETYWHNGIIYKSPTTQSMIKVEYDHEALIFTVEVQDKNKQAIDMQNIVEQFTTLENNNDNIRISNDGKTYIELKTIRKLQHENRRDNIIIEGNVVSLDEYDWLIKKQKIEEPMTLEQLKEKVHTHIKNGRTKEAMDDIETWAHESNQQQLRSDANLLQGAFTKFKRESILGSKSPSENDAKQVQLNDSVLNLVKTIEDVNNESTMKADKPSQGFDWEVEILKYLLSNNKWEGTISEFTSRHNIAKDKYYYVSEVVEHLKDRGLIKELHTLPKGDAFIKATFSAEKFLNNYNTVSVQKAKIEEQRLSILKPKIYFSYAWGDDHETGESREQIVEELYESLKNDGYSVFRDKEDSTYRDLISDMMKNIGKGKFIVVAISDKYLKSPNCMFELYEIYRNSQLEKEKFLEKIFPIRVESIRLSDPKVLDVYFEYWEQQEKEWAELIIKRGTRISPAQHERYKRIKTIAAELGEFLEILSDMNTKTKDDLSENNFEEIKKAIMNQMSS
jgi:internalin A